MKFCDKYIRKIKDRIWDFVSFSCYYTWTKFGHAKMIVSAKFAILCSSMGTHCSLT